MLINTFIVHFQVAAAADSEENECVVIKQTNSKIANIKSEEWLANIKKKSYIQKVSEGNPENPRQFDLIQFIANEEAVKDLALNKPNTHFLVMERKFKNVKKYIRSVGILPDVVRIRLENLNNKITNDQRFQNIPEEIIQLGFWDHNDQNQIFII